MKTEAGFTHGHGENVQNFTPELRIEPGSCDVGSTPGYFSPKSNSPLLGVKKLVLL